MKPTRPFDRQVRPVDSPLALSSEIRPQAEANDGEVQASHTERLTRQWRNPDWARIRLVGAALAGLAVIALGVIAFVDRPVEQSIALDAGSVSTTTPDDADGPELAVTELPEVVDYTEAGVDEQPELLNDDENDDPPEPAEKSTTATTPAVPTDRTAANADRPGSAEALAAPPTLAAAGNDAGQAAAVPQPTWRRARPIVPSTPSRGGGEPVAAPPFVTMSIPRSQQPSLPAPDSSGDRPTSTTPRPQPTEPVVTQPPASNPTVTNPPATEAPATEPPATEAPATEPPATEPPTTAAPTSQPPASPADGVGWYGGGGISGVNCTVRVAPGTAINSAIAGASNGATVCVSGSNRGGEEVRISKPGIQLVATGGVTVKEVLIDGDDVRLEGFEIANGVEGVEITGDDAVVKNNYIHDTSSGGLVCGNSKATVCNGIVVANNTVVRNVGVSVEVWGSNVLIDRNDIRDPLYVRRDTDTLRVMAGRNQIVRGNYMEIPNINARHSSPHPDCIMMFDSDAAQFKDWVINTDVVIENNICVNDSAHNCFILSARRQHRSGNFVIRNNICDHAGANAFFIEDLTNVELSNNLCTSRITKNCIAFVGRVSNALSQNNLFAGSGKLHQINIPSAVSWTDRSNYQGDPRYADTSNSNPWYRYRPGNNSPVRDAGSGGGALGPTDILGRPRVQGGGPDIGPYES